MTFSGFYRTGNQMFLVASTLGIARSYPDGVWTVCVDPRLPIRSVFPAVAELQMCDPKTIRLMKKSFVFREAKAGFYYPETRNFSLHRHTVIQGYIQSWKYFQNISDEIRRLFRFSSAVDSRAAFLMREAVEKHFRCGNCSNDVATVGVHVRRGDRRDVSADVTFLTQAMEHHVARYNRRSVARHVFVVCSDDLKWCRENVGDRDDVVFIEGGDKYVDLAILSMCRDSVITAGSYGWWSAWLANGHTVAYMGWTRDYTMYSKDDYIPPSWIIL